MRQIHSNVSADQDIERLVIELLYLKREPVRDAARLAEIRRAIEGIRNGGEVVSWQ